MTLTDFLIMALGGWRIAYLITHEDGPGNVMGRWREWSLKREWVIKNPKQQGEMRPGSLGKGFTCLRCMSIWGALITYALLISPLWVLAWILAASAASILLSAYTGAEYSSNE